MAAPPPLPPPTLAAIAEARRGTLAEFMRTADEPFSSDFVHDLRVATRRLTEVLGILEVLMAKPAARAVADSLRDARGAGALRDLDAPQEHLARWRFPGPVSKIRHDLSAALPPKRAALTAQLAQLLRAPSLSGAMALLARTLEQAAREPAANDTLGATLEQRIRRRRKQLRKRLGQACLKQDSAALHQARIAIKKLRYALELAHEAGRKRLGQELKFCKRLQSLLGDMHDTDVIVGTLQGHLAPHPRIAGLARA